MTKPKDALKFPEPEAATKAMPTRYPLSEVQRLRLELAVERVARATTESRVLAAQAQAKEADARTRSAEASAIVEAVVGRPAAELGAAKFRIDGEELVLEVEAPKEPSV